MSDEQNEAKSKKQNVGAGIIAQSEALFNSMGDGAITTDEFGRIVRVNPAALKLLGYTESEMIGEWFPKIIVALDDNRVPISLIDRPITKAFLTGKAISERVHYRTKSGDYRPVSTTISPIILDKRPVGAIDVFRDISLERDIDRMKSEFISLASHQLRTPLSSIKTYTHMLADGYMGEMAQQQKRALTTILSAADRMNALINMLLNVSRIESGNILLTIRRYSLNRLISEVLKDHEMTASEKGITLNVKLTDEPTFVRTDNLIAAEVLSNLISNAIKYTPNGGKVIIKLNKKDSGAEISVSDCGIGIPKYSQDHIFTKFFRAQNVISSETTGSGLGLYLVKGLVDTLGGSIWFKSKENTGSTFYLYLPKVPEITS